MKPKRVWMLYIPEDGNWEIPGRHRDEASARRRAVRMLKPVNGLKRLPNGSRVFVEVIHD